MKKIVVLLSLLIFAELGSAQSYKPQTKIDHLAIVVDDLSTSATFYSEILGLKEITNETKKAEIRWFAFADGIELHLINRSKEGIQVKKDLHLALAVNDLTAFIKMLDQKGVYYENWNGDANKSGSRPDGIIQVYVQDPDGYWIEVNDANRF